MTILVAPAAREDLAQAYRYIARENVAAADRVFGRIIEVIGLLASGRIEGRPVSLRDGRSVMTWPVPPYRIYYRKRTDAFEIIRVYHQARRPIER
ncbi:MAG: type II toxin-antitoxin system RelE/ParE family toxin [Nitrospirae bacterium]|nr:type II toxin-antitoxin system RelE/ParE family toxin [Nitrospirota bacterium]